jgi:pimeloyl-ACP methyl ester carboxylesterase
MKKRSRARDLIKLLLVAGVLAAFGCNLQNAMLYYPGSYLPSQAQLAADQIRFWPSDANNYRGFISAAPISRPKGTVVVFHGNAGTASDRAYYVQALAPLGYRVILAEYPGYGKRPGKPGETAFVKDAAEILQLAAEKFEKPLFVLGESLGCGIAAATAKQLPGRIDGLILITPWDTLLSVASSKFPWLPVKLFLTDTYDTIGNLKTFPGRTAVIGAEQDEVVPLRHAQSLYDALNGTKRMWIVRRAGHNDWLDQVGPSWWLEIMDFVSSGQGQGPAAQR